MYRKRRFAVVRVVAAILILAMMIPVGASAATAETIQPRASSYLDSYNAYVYLPGDGEVRVYFNVQGTGYMDELGVLFIELYESTDGSSWDCVKTFNHYAISGLLSYDDYYHSGYVSYNGTVGNYYKAYVCVWAGKGGSGDSRYFWTLAKS